LTLSIKEGEEKEIETRLAKRNRIPSTQGSTSGDVSRGGSNSVAVRTASYSIVPDRSTGEAVNRIEVEWGILHRHSSGSWSNGGLDLTTMAAGSSSSMGP